MHGVRASLALQRSGDVLQALKERNPEAGPHLSFVDAGGHGYAVVCATEDLEVEFAYIPQTAGASGQRGRWAVGVPRCASGEAMEG
jgi:hypothetical protein